MLIKTSLLSLVGHRGIHKALRCAMLAAVCLGLLALPAKSYAQAQEPTARTGCVNLAPDDFVALKSFGPSNEFSFPAYYIDQNDLGLDLCDESTDVDALCGNPPFGAEGGLDQDAPPSIETGNFWHETFYSLANANMTWGTGADAGSALLVLAVEGVWDNEAEAIIPGDQLVFSRIRSRVSLPNDAACAGIYTITHPYGTDILEVTAADMAATLGNRAINMTDDCLHGVVDGVIVPTCGTLLGDQFTNVTDSTRSRISHYLQWDVDAPPGYLGNPLIPHAVTGSPCGTNFYRIEGPCAGNIDPATGNHTGTAQTDLFNVQGRSAQLCGDGILDEAVGETCDDGNIEDGDCCSSTCQADGPVDAISGLPIGPTFCDDGVDCTVDSCVSASGCDFAPSDLFCDDLEVCTTDSCDAGLGCLNEANTDPCDDADFCTQVDTCDGGICVGADPVVCGALDECHEVGTCDTASGVCSDPFSIVDKLCGAEATVCSAQDTCDGLGACQVNDESTATLCGDDGTECINQDKCDGLGACADNGFVAVASACGNSSDTECTNPDSCNGAGSCLDNHEAATATCEDDGTECINQDFCDGGGLCADNGFVAADSACGDGSDTQCTNPDTCNGSGACQENNEPTATSCGDTGTECINQDKCDGGGLCADKGFVAAEIACGHVSDTECTNPDSCNGAGSCLDNHEDVDTNCGDAGTECTNQDLCDGGGSCADNGYVDADSACGDGSDTECTNADTCDGGGACQANDESTDTTCGDLGTECINQDKCDGGGSCADNGFVAADSACGDNATDCSAQDTCDGSGDCQVNDESTATTCGDTGTACVVQDNCDGSGSCADNGFEAIDTSCNTDIDVCTDDVCDGAGICVHPNNTASCEDGDPTTWEDQCSGGSCLSGFFACPMFPLDGCRAPVVPGKSSIYLRTTSGGAKDALKWKWKNGAATSLADYGDPINSDEYSLCLYDEENEVPTLVVEQIIEPGGTCGGKPCWKGSPRMYKYNTKGVVTSHGVGNLKLKRGEDGKASIAAKAKGVGLALPLAPLQADSHLTVQLISQPGECWETVFDAASVTIKNGKLKAK